MDAGHDRGVTGFALLEVPIGVQVKISGTPQTTGQQLLLLRRIIRLLFQDSKVEKVVRLYGSTISYDTLYKVFEVIRGDVGSLIEDLKWMSKAQLKKIDSDSSEPTGHR
jgi:hypothetical protein